MTNSRPRLFGLQILSFVWFDILQGQLIFEYLHTCVGTTKCNPFPKAKDVEDAIEYNPTYFEAIPLDSLKVRVADADLNIIIKDKYKKLIKQHHEAIAAVGQEDFGSNAKGIALEKLAHLRVQEAAMKDYLKDVVDPADSKAALHEHIMIKAADGFHEIVTAAQESELESGDKVRFVCMIKITHP